MHDGHVGGTSPTFDLYTRAGYINLADGTTAYMWGFSEGSKPFQHPGPVLCVNEGDTVTVILHNTFTTTVAQERAGGVDRVPRPGGRHGRRRSRRSRSSTVGRPDLARQAAQPNGGHRHLQLRWPAQPGTFLYESGGGQLHERLAASTRAPRSRSAWASSAP